MRNMDLDGSLVEWTDSFMPDRRVIMNINGQGSDAQGVTAGLIQGAPISPVLFAIYIAEIHAAVENQTESSRKISFADDVTWIVEGDNIGEVVQRLERCAAASLRFVEGNAVRFETETMLFLRKKKH